MAEKEKKATKATKTKSDVIDIAKPSPSSRAANSSRKSKRGATSLPRPETSITVTLKGVESQRLFRRLYERTDAALIWLDTVLDQVASDGDLGEAENIIREKIAACAEDIKQQTSQMQILKEENGLDGMSIKYHNSQNLTVTAQTPLSIRFSHLFTAMDNLLVEIDQLWFAEIIDRAQRKGASLSCRNAITKVSTAIISFNTRAQSLVRKNKTEGKEPEEKLTASA